MPTLLNIFGLRFYFYSDEHLPIHIHNIKKWKKLKKYGLRRIEFL